MLSGFLIGSQLFNKVATGDSISVREFYFKRFFRIIPAYVTVLLLYLCIPLFRERDVMAPLWKFLTFTMNFGLDYQHAGAFSHAWSLCIEEQFYLLFPVLVILLSKIKRSYKIALLMSLIFVLGLIIRWYNWTTFMAPVCGGGDGNLIANTYSKYIYYPTYNRLDGLLVGVTIALLFVFRPVFKDRISKMVNVLFFTGFAMLIGTWFLCRDSYSLFTAVFSYPLVSVGYGFLVLAALSPQCFINRFNSKVFSVLAQLSYTIYLTHKQLNHLVQWLLEDCHLDSNWALLICFVVAVLGGTLLYFTIELPFLRLRDRLLSSGNKIT